MLIGYGTPQASGALADCPNGPLHADLTGAAVNGKTPNGMAMFRDKGSNGLMVMVRDVDTTAGTTLTVMVGTTSVGTINVARNGNGQLKLDSATGISEGTQITVMNGTTTVLSGTFTCTGNRSGNTNTNTNGNTNTNTNTNTNKNTNTNTNTTPTATPTPSRTM